MSVCVVGSVNLDTVVRVPRIPAPGETLLGAESTEHAGGKGNNQAVAAARSGADVVLVGSVGRDPAAQAALAVADASGVGLRCRRTAAPTGRAWITVAEDGENAIVVIPGANGLLADLTDDEVAAVRAARVLLLQQEIPAPTVRAAARTAAEAGAAVVLNAAPSRDADRDLLAAVSVLVVNEHEAGDLLSAPGRTAERAVADLLTLAPGVVLTLGAAGALVGVRGRAAIRVPPWPAPSVVDTTGAGDAFCGALAAELDRRGGATVDALEPAARYAAAVAALAVQRPGAAIGMPWRQEVLAAYPDAVA